MMWKRFGSSSQEHWIHWDAATCLVLYSFCIRDNISTSPMLLCTEPKLFPCGCLLLYYIKLSLTFLPKFHSVGRLVGTAKLADWWKALQTQMLTCLVACFENNFLIPCLINKSRTLADMRGPFWMSYCDFTHLLNKVFQESSNWRKFGAFFL